MRTNCVDLFDFMEAYDTVVRRVGKCVSIGINRKYSMVDATNEILKLTKIDFMFVKDCGRDVFAGSMATFCRIYGKAYWCYLTLDCHQVLIRPLLPS